MSDEKKTNIENEVNDLDYVIRVLDLMEKRETKLYKDNFEMMQELIKARNQVAELTAKKLDL